MTFDYKSQYYEYRKYLEKLKTQVQGPIAQTSLAVVGTIAFCIFLALVAIRPTFVIVASLTRSISDEQTVVEKLDQKIEALQIAQKKLLAVKDRMGAVNLAIPETTQLEVFMRQVETLASEHGLVLLEIKQDPFMLVMPQAVALGPRQAAVQPLNIDIKVGGKESAVRSFIASLIQLDRIVGISSVTIASLSAEDRTEQPYAVAAAIDAQIFTTQQVAIEDPSKKQPATAAAGSEL